ncbi:MAG: Ada metal-binding domain-containing protein [Bdellovibrionota bacterium]
MQSLKDKDLIQVIRRRDKKYDGRFYFGVTTTKIYCRPICPARPKIENIKIFRSLSEAEKSGFRPCLRCHPDIAPGSRFFEGTGKTVSRALKIIGESEGAVSIEGLARSLGVTDRHLRRLFDEQLGASPVEIINTNRLHLAKQLLLESSRPVTEIAFAVGFQSLRRFNEAFKSLYHKSPREVRQRVEGPINSQIALKIATRQPYDFKLILAYLKRHEAFGLEKVEGDTYRRFITSNNGKDKKIGWADITLSGNKKFLEVSLSNIPLAKVRWILNQMCNLFDTDHNPWDATIPQKFSGVRVPGCFDSFEVAISVILSQLISTEQARLKLKTLIEKYGQRIGEVDGQEIYEFPLAKVLARAEVETIGITKVKAEAIRELSRQVEKGQLHLHASAETDAMRKQLLDIRGIGPWTAEMIAMRCLRDPDAFPKNDLLIERALKSKRINEEEWISFRAYLTHAVWSEI